MTTQKWRALVRNLRKCFPLDAPVRVSRRPAKKNHGITTFDGRAFRIYVNADQDKTGQVDTLLHEWAHALAISQAYAHGPQWSVNFAAIYTLWASNFKQEKP